MGVLLREVARAGKSREMGRGMAVARAEGGLVGVLCVRSELQFGR